MKLLLVLLACIAASNAYSYTYSYYCSHNFYVYPTTSCYRYTFYFPSTWCSASYYSPILKVYPGEDCGKAGWSEKSVADVTSEVRNCLATSLAKMSAAMYSKRDEFMKKIDAIHAEYKAYYKKYLTMYYAYRTCGGLIYINDRDAKIAAYNKKLDEKRASIFASYNSLIASKIKTLSEYHAKIVKAAEDCLNTRLAKIADYKKALEKKINDYVTKYDTYLYSIVLKNKEGLRKLLSSLFSGDNDWWLEYKAYWAVSDYHYQEKYKVQDLVNAYRTKLNEYKNKLINYYTCAYRCYMSNACLRFYKKSYYGSCKSLGCWYTYKNTYSCKQYYLAPFVYKYKFVTYKCLKTCDVNAAAGSVAPLIAELKKKMEDALSEHSAQFMTWKTKWIGYHVQYKLAFEQCVKDRHAAYLESLRRRFLYCSSTLTAYQIAELARVKKELDELREAACSKYWLQLGQRIADCFMKHEKSQAAYRKAFEAYIANIQAMFDACIAKRKAAIADYEKKLKESVAKKRVYLFKKIEAAKTCHFNQYKKMLQFYFSKYYTCYSWGSYMSDCYIDLLVRRCNGYMADFDNHWNVLVPKLVQNFACGYTCKVRSTCVPTYYCGGFYSWVYRAPCASSYKFSYCY